MQQTVLLGSPWLPWAPLASAAVFMGPSALAAAPLLSNTPTEARGGTPTRGQLGANWLGEGLPRHEDSANINRIFELMLRPLVMILYMSINVFY